MIGFVVNPTSGNGRGSQVWQQIEKELHNRRIVFSVQFTHKQYDAEHYALQWAMDNSEVTIIVAVGGDGTVHEVVNGMYRAQTTETTDATTLSNGTRTHPFKLFGHIPAGSGNDYARGHQIPQQPLQALELILSPMPKTRCMDLIKMNHRVAVNSIGVGFDGRVARLTNEASYKKLFNQIKLGGLPYVLTMIRELATYRPSTIQLSIDRQTASYHKVWFIVAANIPYYGGGMQICPQANPVSGQAELCVVSRVNRLEFLRVFPKVYKGTHVHHKAIQFYQGRFLEVSSEQILDIHMDGEASGTTPATIEVLPAKLHIIVA